MQINVANTLAWETFQRLFNESEEVQRERVYPGSLFFYSKSHRELIINLRLKIREDL